MGILEIPKLSRDLKETWCHKTFEECGEIRKIKNHMKWNAKFLYCTALGFITKNEEYNPKENVSNGRYLKNLILQKVANNIN